MLSSKKLNALRPYLDIIEKHRKFSFGQIVKELGQNRHIHYKKGAAGLILENLLGLENNSSKKADLENLKVEIKVLPLQLSTGKGKEPTQIKMINFMKVANETWDDAEIRDKIETILWVVYGVNKENGKNVSQDKYVLLDYFIDVPNEDAQKIFRTDWEEIQSYIIKGNGDKLSCSMGTYIEPKTKGKNNKDMTQAPDGKGGTTMVRRRAFYFKKNYTNSNVLDKLELDLG